MLWMYVIKLLLYMFYHNISYVCCYKDNVEGLLTLNDDHLREVQEGY